MERARARVRGLVGLFAGVAALGAGLVGPAPPALADVASAPYSIEAPAGTVAAVEASPAAVVPSAPTTFEVKFKLTVDLSGTSPGAWVSVAPSSPLAAAPTGVTLTDSTAPTCSEAGTGGGALSASVVTVKLSTSCSLAVGDVAEVDFSASAPALPHSLTFLVTTSSNTSPAASNPVVVTSAPAFSSSSQQLGVAATYFIDDASWSDLTLSQSFSAVELNAKALFGSAITFSTTAQGYSATVTVAGATSPDQVLSVSPGPGQLASSVALVLATPVPAGANLDIVATGSNPAATSSVEVAVVPEVASAGALVPAGPGETTSAFLFGTSVGALRVSMSSPVAGALATYTVSFQATTAFSGGPGASICLGELAGPTNFASETAELVADTTAGWQFAASGASYPAGEPPANPGCDAFDNGVVLAVPLGYDVRAGDTLTLVLVNVTNPPASTISDFSVSTSADTVAERAAPYVVAPSGSPGVLVAVSPATTGTLATYTLSGLVASSQMSGGSTAVTVEGPAGTVFPNDPADYDVVDLSAPSTAPATVKQLVSGGGTSTVALVVPADVNAGDHLVVIIEDTVNPASSSADYTLTLIGPVRGGLGLAPFPRANVSYPNGAIVGFGGTFYVFAGGHAFGVPSEPALYAIEKVDRAEPQTAVAGTQPPQGALRPGTLVFTRPVNGQPTIYVAGTDGDLHGFATPSQLLGDGYDPALVVTVPSLRGVAVGAPAGSLGSAANAPSTSADGALVSAPNGWYVFAGGRAFAVPARSLGLLRRIDRAAPLFGALAPAQLNAQVANGVLFSASGVVYVSYAGELWPFKSPSQLAADGYGGTAAVPVPSHGGLVVVKAYSGS